MNDNGVFSAYFEAAMKLATFEKLDDGTYLGKIDECPGLLGFGLDQDETVEDLRINLEDWVLLGLRLNAKIPPIAGIDLTSERALEPVDAL